MVGGNSNKPRHPVFNRRDILQAGTIGLMGLSLPQLHALRALAPTSQAAHRPRSVIFLFLSGGMGQHETFDLKPDAPENIRGEFDPIRTKTPGIYICEHLPRLAARSDKWALVRSLSHSSNDHSLGHHIMLTGRSDAPPGFNATRPQPGDYPSIASVAGYFLKNRNHLAGSAVVPFNYVHHSGRIVPGQFAGQMGAQYDPWLIQAAHNCPGYGACPNCFDHERRPGGHIGDPAFQPPNLRLPEEITQMRLGQRRRLLDIIDDQRRSLDRASAVSSMGRYRESATSLLTSGQVRAAFDLGNEKPGVLDAYGRNLFGWSCLLARRLVEVGVGLVQVNLGRNETWDTHGNMFPHLKNDLLPPTDQCVSALIDDLEARGLLDSTMIVMAGEFGRTPRISTLTQFYELPGRDHWGAVQTVFFAGGGVRGGTVIGDSDRIGAFPKSAKQTPENMAATIYQALGIDRTACWYDATHRPFFVYQADPIDGLTS